MRKPRNLKTIVLLLVLAAMICTAAGVRVNEIATDLRTGKPTVYAEIFPTASAAGEQQTGERILITEEVWQPTLKRESTKTVTVVPAEEPEPVEPEFVPSPITEEELTILAKVIYREAGGVRGIYGGVSYRARQAAVAWCALNRLDDPRFPDTLKKVLTQPYAFAYIENTPVDPELLQLAADVTNRWWAEQQGQTDVGRTLPSGYFYFWGDGRENHFRDEYTAPYKTWDWSCVDPYKEG